MKRVLIVHNVRSCHNVGSILRSADAFGIKTVYLTGYTPYPLARADSRLPHLAQKTHRQIIKTSLGAEQSVRWQHEGDISTVLGKLSAEGYQITALEQAPSSVDLADYSPPDKLALIVGREVEGIEAEILQKADVILEIAMHGQKESLNVANAAAIAMFFLTRSRWTAP